MSLKEEILNGLVQTMPTRRVQIRPGPDNRNPFTFNSVEDGKRDPWNFSAPSVEALVDILGLNRMWARMRCKRLVVDILVPGLTPAALQLVDDEIESRQLASV
ncbi:hypothetical protein A2419_03605 [Candidatus Adlerbacteria bacterium RIFOXYC1_FULL_48_26]|uniref:Uncharacterized protein n=1 Tax=Candidatus Adlerbacteria bacterium RIFOXYC1_FULL_48_26 TaxID=1797247 RepID=A0A1F4Y4K0_9BACT|nr:MAG: hypothetical protein A2419_03605 [Candidatus Adlerbacteria bacterium RIFOXYC1_FULL_48_26]OGC93582.1 MAG: hypothetical protein A2389_00865 [Candidatus Adlerbacteria bacterium RIFOXYB1_FULL_48_10]